ncbi:MAG: type II toxin-antitoxin system VapC family toxin [Terriglobales bacterium]
MSVASNIYADTSFFVSLYLTEQHTPEAERRLRSRPFLCLTPLHVAEWIHAIEQHVFHKAISRSAADRLLQRFQEHRAQGLWREAPLPDRAFEVCAELARRYAARLGVRTLDTLHVASALELGAERFWTFDERQAKLALAVAMKID